VRATVWQRPVAPGRPAPAVDWRLAIALIPQLNTRKLLLVVLERSGKVIRTRCRQRGDAVRQRRRAIALLGPPRPASRQAARVNASRFVRRAPIDRVHQAARADDRIRRRHGRRSKEDTIGFGHCRFRFDSESVAVTRNQAMQHALDGDGVQLRSGGTAVRKRRRTVEHLLRRRGLVVDQNALDRRHLLGRPNHTQVAGGGHHRDIGGRRQIGERRHVGLRRDVDNGRRVIDREHSSARQHAIQIVVGVLLCLERSEAIERHADETRPILMRRSECVRSRTRPTRPQTHCTRVRRRRLTTQRHGARIDKQHLRRGLGGPQRRR
jgi:hypothetical protein